MIFIVVRKLPQLAAINVETIAKEKETKVKNRIIIDRLARRFYQLKKLLIYLFEPLVKNLQITGTKIYEKTLELEKKESKPTKPLDKVDVDQQIKEKIIEAKRLIADGEFDRAEEACISIITLDSKNLDCYGELTKVYIEKKEYKKARETCRYLIKLLNKQGANEDNNGQKHLLANCFADLGWIYQLEGKNGYALTNYQKAVELEPINPRFLDLLLKISIILKNKKLALEAFSHLKKADPENQKLDELKSEIDNLPT